MSYPLMDKSPRPENGDFCPDTLSSSGSHNIPDKKQDFSILEKLKDLRDKKKYCDIILEVRGTKLEAHKNVLASWSPYFASKLFPDDQKVCKDFVSVNYNNSEVFADLLDFMYNGYVAPRETNFLELLHLAVSFQIQMLKNYCEEFLRCNLHLGNFVSTYFLSRKFRLESLEEYIVGFLQLNLSDAVKQGEFLSLTASKFNTFLSSGSMEKIKPEIKLFLIISWVGYDVQDREKYLVLLLGHIDWSTVANDFLLEINRTENFFTSHESSLYLLLQTLFSTGIPLGPYTDVFPMLRDRHSAILNEVVSSSVIQIEHEDYFPVTIVVRSRPNFKEAATSTNFLEKVDCAINTDVNSRHFEEHEAETVDQAGSPAEPVHDETVPKFTQDVNERYDEFGKFIESEIYELNKKGCAKTETEQTTELLNVPESEVEASHDTALNTVSRYDTRKRRKKIKTYSNSDRYEKISEEELEGHEEVTDSKFNVSMNSVIQDQDIQYDTVIDEGQQDKATHVTSELIHDVSVRATRYKDRLPSHTKITRKRQKTAEKIPQKEVQTIPCTYDDCPYFTTIRERLEKHVKSAHLCSFELRCNLCSFISKEVRKYNLHMKTHFAGPPYKCDHPRCTYNHNRISKLIRHRDGHTDERPFTCECGKSFRTNNTLAAHKKTHEGKKEYKCPICGVAFAKKNTVNQHIVTHSNARPYLCDLCGFATKFQSHLIAHKRIHTGDVFGCSFPKCTYVTPKRSQLKAHMRAHLGVRAHVCQTCGKSFVEKSHLLRHEKLHTSERLECSDCDYTTTRKDKLREHIAKYHVQDIEVMAKTAKKQKMITTNKVKKSPNTSRNKKVNAKYTTEITTPMLVKWDHGGYSLTQKGLESPSTTTEGDAIMTGDAYCVLRDQLTTSEPIQQLLTLNQVQMNGGKVEEGTMVPINPDIGVSLSSTDTPSMTHLQNSVMSTAVELVTNQPPIDHVSNGAIVTTVMEGDSNGQTYTIIQPAAGTTVPSQEYGGLSAFMALF